MSFFRAWSHLRRIRRLGFKVLVFETASQSEQQDFISSIEWIYTAVTGVVL